MIRDHFRYLRKPGQYAGIDALRAIAVSAVVLFHFEIFKAGWIGVDLFFVLSGFLIGGLLMTAAEQDGFSYATYVGHRALRILPTYYAALLTFILFRAIPQGVSVHPGDLWPVLTLTHTTAAYFLGVQVPWQFGPDGSWSLVIEAHFYLIAPLIIVPMFRYWGVKGVAIVALGAMIAAPLVRLYMTAPFAPDDPNWHFASFVQFHSRFDELAFGVLAAALARMNVVSRVRKIALFIAALPVFALFVTVLVSGGFWDLPQTMTRETIWVPTALGFVFFVCVVLLKDLPKLPSSVVVLARLSYAIYLFHFVVISFVKLQPDAWMVLTIGRLGFLGSQMIYMIASLALAYLISLFIEFPFISIYRARKKKPAVI